MKRTLENCSVIKDSICKRGLPRQGGGWCEGYFLDEARSWQLPACKPCGLNPRQDKEYEWRMKRR